jgi:molybdopterin-guanine dinucleotide biosynthesis protein A
MSHLTPSGAILAGGQSTRFGGRDKRARLADRRLRVRELADSLRTRIVPVDEIRKFGDPDRLLANVNTPADYADLEALQGHKL